MTQKNIISNKIIAGITRVKRGAQYGIVESYNPKYKAAITVRWDSGKVEGWFDVNGTDGTDNAQNHIRFSNHK